MAASVVPCTAPSAVTARANTTQPGASPTAASSTGITTSDVRRTRPLPSRDTSGPTACIAANAASGEEHADEAELAVAEGVLGLQRGDADDVRRQRQPVEEEHRGGRPPAAADELDRWSGLVLFLRPPWSDLRIVRDPSAGSALMTNAGPAFSTGPARRTGADRTSARRRRR